MYALERTLDADLRSLGAEKQDHVDAMIRHIGWVQGVPSELRLKFSDMCVFTRFFG